MAQVYLLLGSNSGDSVDNLKAACSMIGERLGKIIASSSLYSTEPWGLKDQPSFLNQLIIVETTHLPAETLSITLQIEKELGRERINKWGPRTLDIDILYFDNEIVVTSDLKIPHPEIQFRRFALIPLTEVAPDFKHPVLNITNREMLSRCEDALAVEKIN